MRESTRNPTHNLFIVNFQIISGKKEKAGKEKMTRYTCGM